MEHDCARPHWPRCSALRAAACARNAVVRSTSQPSTVASRSRAEKNFAKSSLSPVVAGRRQTSQQISR